MGKAFPKKGNKVGIYAPDGTLGDIDPEQLHQALASNPKLSLAPDTELQRARLVNKWDQQGVRALGLVAAATGGGLIHGVSAGFLDPIITEGAKAFLGEERGKEVKELLKDSKT